MRVLSIKYPCKDNHISLKTDSFFRTLSQVLPAPVFTISISSLEMPVYSLPSPFLFPLTFLPISYLFPARIFYPLQGNCLSFSRLFPVFFPSFSRLFPRLFPDFTLSFLLHFSCIFLALFRLFYADAGRIAGRDVLPHSGHHQG